MMIQVTRSERLKIIKSMSWLINSMKVDIGENFLLYETAKEIWEAVRETYSSSESTSELFAI